MIIYGPPEMKKKSIRRTFTIGRRKIGLAGVRKGPSGVIVVSWQERTRPATMAARIVGSLGGLCAVGVSLARLRAKRRVAREADAPPGAAAVGHTTTVTEADMES
jgi:hypothetical protein